MSAAPALRPFTTADLEAAAALFARDLTGHRRVAPGAPRSSAAFGLARRRLGALWAEPGVSGVAAVRDGALVAYLLGRTREDELLGPVADVPLVGWVAPAIHGPGGAHPFGRSSPWPVLGALYAAAATRWVNGGVLHHRVMVRARPRAVRDAWADLGFGGDQVYAYRGLASTVPSSAMPPPAGATVRRAGPGDADALREAALWIARENAAAPAWVPLTPGVAAALREGYAGLMARRGWVTYLVEVDGRVHAFAVFAPVDPEASTWWWRDGAVELEVAGTHPESRRQGLATLVLHHALAEARAAGARTCVLDWHQPNLAASAFWPRRGFVPAAYRLSRRLAARAGTAARSE